MHTSKPVQTAFIPSFLSCTSSFLICVSSFLICVSSFLNCTCHILISSSSFLNRLLSFLNWCFISFFKLRLKRCRYLSNFILFWQLPHRWGRPLNPTGQFTPSSPSTRVTCKFGIGGFSRLTCKDPDKFMQVFTRRHVPRATCVAHPWKVQKHASAGWVYPPWKFGANMPRTVSTPDSRNLDRQTEGGKDRQKMPTYIPRINFRNKKNLQMLKHMGHSMWNHPKKVPFWPRPSSISAKIGEPIVPHDRNMYAQF